MCHLLCFYLFIIFMKVIMNYRSIIANFYLILIQEPSADALKRYLAYGRPNSMIFMHPTRSLTEKRSGIYLPRPNSLMNAIKGIVSQPDT